MSIKKTTIGMGVIVVCALLVLPVHGFLTPEEQENNAVIAPFDSSVQVKNVATRMTVEPLQKSTTPAMLPVALTASDQITSNPEDEYSPVVAGAPDGTTLLSYTFRLDLLTSDIPWRYSTDGGQTWSDGVRYEIEGGEQNPAVDWRGGERKFCGTFQDPINGDGANQYMFLAEDITDPETYSMPYIEWAGSYPYRDRLIPAIAGYDGLEDIEWWWGIMSVVGTRDERVNMPIFNYDNYEEDGSQWSSYFDTYQGCEHTAIDVDYNSGLIYTVFDYYNESVGNWNILLVPGDCHPDTSGDAGHPTWFNSSILGGTEDNRYPDVSTVGNTVLIVAQADEQIPGKQDIVCYYSTDRGATWNKSLVGGDINLDEMYPSVVCYGSSGTCVFTIDNDLYISHTTDSGATWTTPERVNDEEGTVAAAYHCADITSGGLVVWADNSAGNLDIYSENVGLPPSPIISIGEITGGFGLQATVLNSGSVDAENAAWSIVFDGLVFVGSEKTGTVTVPAGGQATISTGLILGIGRADITVTVEDAVSTASGFVLGPFILGLS